MSQFGWIYRSLPIGLQTAAVSFAGWRRARQRYQGAYRRLAREALDRQHWPAEALFAYRDQQLQRFVLHAATTVPYYRQLFADLKIAPQEIRQLDDLAQLPVLTRQTVQQAGSALRSDAFGGRRLIKVRTSGTTGSTIEFMTTPTAIQQRYAVWWRYWGSHGLQPGISSAQFGGWPIVPLDQRHPPFWRYNASADQVLFSAYHLRRETADAYLGELARRRPAWLLGYPSTLALLAAFILERRKPLPYTPGWISLGSESVLPAQERLIASAFGVAPIQHYGLEEASANLSQCPAGKLHIDEDYAAVSLLPDPDLDCYRLLGTNFSNPVWPLLRYDAGDLVSVTDERCSCGNAGRIVSRIDGRQEDYLILRSGARIGRIYHIFNQVNNIQEAQLVQRRPGEVELRVMRAAAYSDADERHLLACFQERLGSELQVHICYPAQLERSARGKLRLVVSQLDEGQLARIAEGAIQRLPRA